MKAFVVGGVDRFKGNAAASVLPLVLITPALFAVNMLMARWAESVGMPPWFLAFGRWTVALLILLPWVAPRFRVWWPLIVANWTRLGVLAVLGMAVAVGPQYVGARSTSAANIALIFSACPVLVGLIEAIGWKIPLGRVRSGGMVLSLVGVLVVLARGDATALLGLEFGAGDGWVLLAAVGWAMYTVLGKRFALPPMPVVVRLAALAAGGVLALAPFALIEYSTGTQADFADPRLYGALAVLALVPSLGAYLCYDRLVTVAGSVGASVSMYMVPLYASLAAWPLLGETPQLYHAFGLGLILAGVLVSGRQGQGAPNVVASVIQPLCPPSRALS